MNTSKKLTGSIITAGGSSNRFGSNKLLALMPNCKKTVICASVEKFLEISDIVCVPCANEVREVVQNYFKSDKIIFASPGKTRQESVFHGLEELEKFNLKNVLIHDGARPFIEEKTIKEALLKLKNYKGVCVGVYAVDTIKITDGKNIIKTIDRNTVFQAQTPQCFDFETIYYAHKKLEKEAFTDDSSMLEFLNIPVFALQGSVSNKKITFKEDLT